MQTDKTQSNTHMQTYTHAYVQGHINTHTHTQRTHTHNTYTQHTHTLCELLFTNIRTVITINMDEQNLTFEQIDT